MEQMTLESLPEQIRIATTTTLYHSWGEVNDHAGEGVLLCYGRWLLLAHPASTQFPLFPCWLDHHVATVCDKLKTCPGSHVCCVMAQSKEGVFALLCGNGGWTECTRSTILSVIAVEDIILPAWVCYTVFMFWSVIYSSLLNSLTIFPGRHVVWCELCYFVLVRGWRLHCSVLSIRLLNSSLF